MTSTIKSEVQRRYGGHARTITLQQAPGGCCGGPTEAAAASCCDPVTADL